jgi:small subunit ribosomal protein S2
MSKITFDELLKSGAHFGHLKAKWNPAMAQYIFQETKGIHIIDLNKTISSLEQSCAAMKQIAKSGKKILFVATKKQAKEILSSKVSEINMPFVTERWTGGMLTNFQTTRKSIRKMTSIDKMKSDGSWDTLNKREKLFKSRQREKLEKNFGSISDMTRQPAAIFIVDILKEKIALSEARKLNIPTFAIVDTNSNPKLIDFPIPANDDATKSIALILDHICVAIKEGLEERKNARAARDEEKKQAKETVKSEEKTAVIEEVKAEVVTDEVKTEVVESTEEKPSKKAAPAKKATTAKKAAPAKKATTAKKAAPAKKSAPAKKTTTAKKAEKEVEAGTEK